MALQSPLDQFWMGGIIGMFFRAFGLTVAVSTLFSLLVSFTVTPWLASRWYKLGEDLETRRGVFRGLEFLLEKYPARVLGWHGPERRPQNVWAAAFREASARPTPEQFARYRTLLGQYAHEPLAPGRRLLYQLGRVSTNPRFGKFTGIQDVTVGNISDNGVTGPSAGPGYDMATGWGTIDGAYFVPALALAASRQDGDSQGD